MLFRLMADLPLYRHSGKTDGYSAVLQCRFQGHQRHNQQPEVSVKNVEDCSWEIYMSQSWKWYTSLLLKDHALKQSCVHIQLQEGLRTAA